MRWVRSPPRRDRGYLPGPRPALLEAAAPDVEGDAEPGEGLAALRRTFQLRRCKRCVALRWLRASPGNAEARDSWRADKFGSADRAGSGPALNTALHSFEPSLPPLEGWSMSPRHGGDPVSPARRSV